MMLIDFYSRYPRWLFRTTDAKRLALPGRNVCRNTIGSEGQRVAERLMQRQPIDVAHFRKERFHTLFDEWQSLIRQHAIQVEYDAWMDQRYVQGPASSVTLKRGRVVFDLVHGAVYQVRGKDGSGRIFRVQLADDFPYVSFRDPASGADYPWVGLPAVFTQAELMTLRRMY
ncbi:hypothetical protein D2917_31545 (plasmid) [Cupriavidus oxalaticus]|uniref:Uncharacterized protein n=2 Tax=Cupriavidus oxalaticus TaxID=96344 RepID=A0A5P3VU55_9BURK|nr:hypothetical protein D2917_31545 [Cupriavidus oxalaticus]